MNLSRLNDFLCGWRRSIVPVLVICALCAVMLTWVIGMHFAFWPNLVFSVCIGMTTMTLIRGGYALLWGDGRPATWGLGALVTVAAPAGFVLGGALASAMLGLPFTNFGLNHLHANTAVLVMSVLVSLLATWYFWTQGRLERMKADTALTEQRALEARMQLLQAQIEPHMLFNTLANLQGLITLDPQRAQHLLDQLIHYLRATLSSSRSALNTLEQEFALTGAYLELMSMRMGKRLSYTLELPAELTGLKVPPMLLQPLVENAIRHGLEPNISGGNVTVSATLQQNVLTLSVRNNGLGLDQPGVAGDGIGTANVRERLRLLYGASATFSLSQNQPAGALAQLTIPMKS
ncbi:hypothetical protein RCH09_001627 [Actimicrobium sp. GrIS 1.19]|uniref:sensor histidine kinase n=1 Tax=Actimicrobium sp. GrIS 1.19 TaxID=3071708 RepID=UPI002E03BA7A|nr:hypothetical protein [Actimicrobium sp. GrIS 1.19]